MKFFVVDLDGPLHVADFGGSGPAVVLLHSLGGSHANWLAVGARLAQRARVLCPDLPGFGLTALAGRSAAVHANQRLVGRFLDEIVGAPAILVGNSMGGMIALLEAAAHPHRVAGLVLVDPWVPCPPYEGAAAMMRDMYQTPGLASFLVERRALLSPEDLVRQTLRVACADPARVPPYVVDAAVRVASAQARMPAREAGFLQAAQSLFETVHKPEECVRSIRAVSAPTLVVHGDQDRFVPLATILNMVGLRPDWAFEALEGVGHHPQLEAPARLVRVISDWLDDLSQVGAHRVGAPVGVDDLAGDRWHPIG